MKRSLVRAAEFLAPRLLFDFRVSKYSTAEPEQRLVPFFCDERHAAIDVGANIGIYAGLMVRHAKVCHAFEANPYLARQLQRAAVPRLIVTHAAVSDKAGEVTLHVPRRINGLATLEASNAELRRDDLGPVDVLRVPAVRLDDLRFDGVSFIKIDVEGHEEAVLRGAVRTLAAHRPSLLVESDNRHNPGVVRRTFALLQRLDYAGFFLRDALVRPLAEFDEERHQNPEVLARMGPALYTYNFIFLPAERAAEMAGRLRALAALEQRSGTQPEPRARAK